MKFRRPRRMGSWLGPDVEAAIAAVSPSMGIALSSLSALSGAPSNTALDPGMTAASAGTAPMDTGTILLILAGGGAALWLIDKKKKERAAEK